MGRFKARTKLIVLLLRPVAFYPFWFVWMTFFHQNILGTETYLSKYDRLLGRPVKNRHVSEVSAQFWMFVEGWRRAIGRAFGEVFRIDAIVYTDENDNMIAALMDIRQDTEWRIAPVDELLSAKDIEQGGDNPANLSAKADDIGRAPTGKRVIDFTKGELDDMTLKAKDRYKLWWKAYEELLQEPAYKDKSRSWISIKLTKLPIGAGYQSSYIYRHMCK